MTKFWQGAKVLNVNLLTASCITGRKTKRSVTLRVAKPEKQIGWNREEIQQIKGWMIETQMTTGQPARGAFTCQGFQNHPDLFHSAATLFLPSSLNRCVTQLYFLPLCRCGLVWISSCVLFLFHVISYLPKPFVQSNANLLSDLVLEWLHVNSTQEQSQRLRHSVTHLKKKKGRRLGSAGIQPCIKGSRFLQSFCIRLRRCERSRT